MNLPRSHVPRTTLNCLSLVKRINGGNASRFTISATLNDACGLYTVIRRRLAICEDFMIFATSKDACGLHTIIQKRPATREDFAKHMNDVKLVDCSIRMKDIRDYLLPNLCEKFKCDDPSRIMFVVCDGVYPEEGDCDEELRATKKFAKVNATCNIHRAVDYSDIDIDMDFDSDSDADIDTDSDDEPAADPHNISVDDAHNVPYDEFMSLFIKNNDINNINGDIPRDYGDVD